MEQSVVLAGVDSGFFDSLEARLVQNGLGVMRSSGGGGVLENSEQQRFDAVVAEVCLPDMPVAELCRQLRFQSIYVPILVCTDRELAVEAVLVYESGADSYFSKSIDWVVIEAKIRSALRRCVQSSQSQLAAATHQTYRDSYVVKRDQEVLPGISTADLTRFEERLLAILSRANGRVVSKAAIVEVVWGRHRVETNSLYELVSTLRSKLLTSGWRIVNVRGTGYRLERLMTDRAQPVVNT